MRRFEAWNPFWVRLPGRMVSFTTSPRGDWNINSVGIPLLRLVNVSFTTSPRGDWNLCVHLPIMTGCVSFTTSPRGDWNICERDEWIKEDSVSFTTSPRGDWNKILALRSVVIYRPTCLLYNFPERGLKLEHLHSNNNHRVSFTTSPRGDWNFLKPLPSAGKLQVSFTTSPRGDWNFWWKTW